MLVSVTTGCLHMFQVIFLPIKSHHAVSLLFCFTISMTYSSLWVPFVELSSSGISVVVSSTGNPNIKFIPKMNAIKKFPICLFIFTFHDKFHDRNDLRGAILQNGSSTSCPDIYILELTAY